MFEIYYLEIGGREIMDSASIRLLINISYVIVIILLLDIILIKKS